MGRFLLGFRSLFQVWFDGAAADRVGRALAPAPEVPPEAPKKIEPPKPVAPPPPRRSEALTLLAALQREARFLDFLKEPIDAYSDAQVGAAVRSIHRDCAAVVERMFAVRPILNETEGARVSVPENADAGRYRLTGKVTDRPAGQGRLVHPGWEATQVALPQWTGSDATARILAPVEVELS